MRPCRRSTPAHDAERHASPCTTIDGTSQVVTITINGANDAAVITGTSTGAVVEAGGVANGTPGTPTATGDLTPPTSTIANDACEAVARRRGQHNGYGSYTLTAAGRVDLHAGQQQCGGAGAQCDQQR